MRRDPLFYAVTVTAIFALAGPTILAASPSTAQRRICVLDADLSGSWDEEDYELQNRADLQLSAFGATLRAIANDERRSEPENIGEGTTDFAFGVYHPSTSSRILYGPLEQTGLPHRIASPFGRSLPFADDRDIGEVEIESDAPIGREPSLHAAFGTPIRWPVRALASALVDPDANYVASATTELAARHDAFLRVEGTYVRRDLEERHADSWFSETPPLPARPLKVYAAGAVLSSSPAALACDAALSDAYAEGVGMYGNAALRLGDAPWRLSVAAEAASQPYIGPNGDAVGLGFRTASRIERASTRTRGGLFRGDFRTAHPYIGSRLEAFDAALSFRLGQSAAPIRFDRTAISGEWSVDEVRPLIDATQLDARATFGFVSMATSLRTTFEPSEDGLGGRLWDSSTIRLGLYTELGPIDLRAGVGRKFQEDGDASTEATFGAAISLRGFTLGLKLDIDEVPGPASIQLSWRIREHSRIRLPAEDTP
jgi:hypothetical protein